MKRLVLLLPLLLSATQQSGPNVTHVFPSPGSYPVTLTVCDRAGTCSSVTKLVTVRDPKPSPPALSLPARVGSAQLSLSLIAAAGGRPPLSWAWTVTRADRTASLSSNPATWTFDALGPHTVQASARNAWGSSTSHPVQVDVVPSSFHDVAPDFWAFEAIETLAAAGIGAGCSNSPRDFCPDRPVTRAEAAVLLAAAAFGPLDRLPPATGIFTDVPRGHWAAVAVEQLARTNVAAGCSSHPRRFCPDQVADRAPAAVLVARAMRRGTPFSPPPASGLFTDVPTSFWAAPYIEQLARDGITTGCSAAPPRYCPQAPLTRAQLAVLLVAGFRLAPTPAPVAFAPKLCPACTFAVQTPIVFHTAVTRGIPAAYDYDWNGDGAFEEASTLPLLAHAYAQPGTYSPVLRVRRGSHSAQLASGPIRITAASSSGLPARPTSLRAMFQRIAAPAPSEPPGSLPRALFLVGATSSRALAFNAYLSINGSPFRLVDVLPVTDATLAVAPFASSDNVTLQLRPINSSGTGPSSLSTRLSLP